MRRDQFAFRLGASSAAGVVMSNGAALLTDVCNGGAQHYAARDTYSTTFTPPREASTHEAAPCLPLDTGQSHMRQRHAYHST